MVSKREEGQKPWMAADEYGRSLKGFSLNLLVRDVPRSVAFCRDVLEAQVVYGDADFAVLRRDCRGVAVEWMLHADHTYSDHPLLSLTGDGAIRGAGPHRLARRLDGGVLADRSGDGTSAPVPAADPVRRRDAAHRRRVGRALSGVVAGFADDRLRAEEK